MLRGWMGRIAAWWRGRRPTPPVVATKLQRVILNSGVSQTLFDDFREHRQSARGDEEIGWVLLGHRQGPDMRALAALPAGTQRDAGVAHVLFNQQVQELLSHLLRQRERRLSVVGIVHTHPGSMRYPSSGDLQGDRDWVNQLRGGEGVFAIGTADVRENAQDSPALEHQQLSGSLCFSWYTLGKADAQYRPLPVQIADGPDLTNPYHGILDILETHAGPLNRLYRQLARIDGQAIEVDGGPLFAATIPLPWPGQQLRLLLNQHTARYYWEHGDELVAIDPDEPQVDRAVYLILAELAKSATLASRDVSLLVDS